MWFVGLSGKNIIFLVDMQENNVRLHEKYSIFAFNAQKSFFFVVVRFGLHC